MMRVSLVLLIIAVAAGAALFPLSLALGRVDLGAMGLSARDVSGTIWNGHVGDLDLRGHSLGAFNLRLAPQSLLGDTPGMDFVQAGGGNRPLTGSLRADGSHRGISATSGRLKIGDLFGALPIDTLVLSNVTMMFDGRRCAEASGKVSGDVAIGVRDFSIKRTLDGALSCQDDRVRIALRSVTGIEHAELLIAPEGAYDAVVGVDATRSGFAGSLALLGFRRRGDDMQLVIKGRF